MVYVIRRKCIVSLYFKKMLDFVDDDHLSDPLDTQDSVIISKSLVGPWRNKNELKKVYTSLFGVNANRETQQYALKLIKIWKMRLMTLTPASILATYVLLDVHLKDVQSSTHSVSSISSTDLQIIYSNALTRFLNYLHSMTRSSKSMYGIAKDLGLETFIVDLRHLCAHGQILPSLDIFRRATVYCLNWLKGFYWEREVKAIQDAKIYDIMKNNTTHFEQQLDYFMSVYDFVTEGLHKNYEEVSGLKKDYAKNRMNKLLRYAKQVQKRNLLQLQIKLIKSLSHLINTDRSVKEKAAIFSHALCQCQYFLKSPIIGKIDEKTESQTGKNFSLTKLHQSLFQLIAMHGFLQSCLFSLITIAEDNNAMSELRYGATYWACKIVEGFIEFQKLKKIYCQIKNLDVDNDLKSNSFRMDKNIKLMYKSMGICRETSLIFTDSILFPWSLSLDRKYLEERIINVSSVTEDLIESCLQLSDPPLSSEQQNVLKKSIRLYTTTAQENNDISINVEKIFTIQDVFSKLNKEPNIENMAMEMQEIESSSTEQQYGLWSAGLTGTNWSICPLGTLPWQQ